MSVLSPNQAAQYAYNAEFRGNDLVTITAIAWAESSLNTNPSGNPTHRGILQFDAGTAAQAGYTWADMLEPAKAFRAAYNLVYGNTSTRTPRRGFQPWQTYTNKMYQRFVADVRQVAGHLGGSSSSSSGSSPLDPGNIAGTIGSWFGLPSNPTNPNAGSIGVPGLSIGLDGITQELGAVGSAIQNVGSIPFAMDLQGAATNAVMDAGRSLLPYLVVLAIIGVGLFFIASGILRKTPQAQALNAARKAA